MSNKPDFIADPSGNVRDVRGQESAQDSQSSSQPSTNGPATSVSRSTQGTPGGVVFIPIGLIITLICAVLRMSGGVTQQNGYPESDVNTLNLGLSYYDQGDYEMAITQFNIVIASQPDMGEAYNDRGLAYFALGDTENAMTDFTKAIELLPNSASAHSNRGALYFYEGNYEQALADLDKAIELSPRLAKAYQNRGLMYLDQGDYDKAIVDFSKAIELTPEFPFTAQATFESRSSTQDSMFGGSAYTSLMDRADFADLPMVYVGRAMAYLQKGDQDRASLDLDKAIQLGVDPEVAHEVESWLSIYTSEPTVSPWLAPQIGHWEGISNQSGYTGMVSFDIGEDGQIHNFKLDLIFGPDNSCLVEAPTIFVEANGSFALTYDPLGYGNSLFIQGYFGSSTFISGNTAGTITCSSPKDGHLNSGESHGDSWSAQWVSD